MTKIRSQLDVENQFWAYVNKNGLSHPIHGQCWEWTGSSTKGGYGQFRGLGTGFAHRVSWVIHFGPVPEGKQVHHHCDNPCCVNPKHLWVGTQQDNIDDMYAKGRESHTGAVGSRNISAKHPEYRQGERNGRAKLTEKEVLWIREKYSQKELTQTKLATIFGVTQGLIGHIVRRIAWKHI